MTDVKLQKIRFVKAYGRYKIGDTHETVERKCQLLIKQGFAVLASEPKKIQHAVHMPEGENADAPQPEKATRHQDKRNKPDAVQSKTSEG